MEAPEGSIRSRLYHERVLQDPENLLYNTESQATSLLLSRPDAVAFESSITFSPVPGVVPMPAFADAQLLHNCIVLRRRSEFKDFLDHHLIKLDQSGVRKKLLAKWGLREASFGQQEEGGRSAASATAAATAATLDYDNLALPFVLLGCGVVASWLLAVAEQSRCAWAVAPGNRCKKGHSGKGKEKHRKKYARETST